MKFVRLIIIFVFFLKSINLYMNYLLDYIEMVKQKKEISDKVIIILLILAILFSVGGSILIYESVQDLRSGFDGTQEVQSSTGMVVLEVVDDVNVGGGIDEGF